MNQRYTPLPETIDHDDLIREVDRHLPFSIQLCCTSGTRQGHAFYKGKYFMTKLLVAQVGRDGVTYVVKVHNFVDDRNEFDEHIEHRFTDAFEAIKKYNFA